MRHLTLILLPILAIFFLAGCSTDSEPASLAGTSWAYSLDNSAQGFAIDAFGRLGVNGELTVAADTVLLRDLRFGIERAFPLVPLAMLPTAGPEAVALTRLADGNLQLSLLSDTGDEVAHLYTPPSPPLPAAPLEEMVGKTYLFQLPGHDSARVYFGYAAGLHGTGEGYYYVSGSARQEQKSSYVIRGGDLRSSLFLFTPRPLQHPSFLFFGGDKSALGSGQSFQLSTRPGGDVFAHYVDRVKDKYRRIEADLRPVPEGEVSKLRLEAFTERINTGRQVIDASYPPVDTVGASFRDEADFLKKGGVSFAELDRVRMEFNPEGEYFLFAGERLLRFSRYELSPDGNYLILLDKRGQPTQHLPILRFTDERIELRFPLLVATRKPLGVKLTSFVTVDALLRIEG